VVVVEEDPAAFRLPPFATREVGRAPFHLTREGHSRFGEQGVVELGTIVGYYTAIGNVLNAFQVPLPPGAPQPFPE
jgi:hypothetical protein